MIAAGRCRARRGGCAGGAALGGSEDAAAQKSGLQGGARQRRRRLQRQRIQQEPARGTEGSGEGDSRDQAYHVRSRTRSNDYQPNYNACCGRRRQHHHRGRLPARRHDEDVRAAVSEHQVRDHRRPRGSRSAGSRTRRASPTRRAGGCLVGVLAAKQAKSMGKKIIGVVGGIKIPPVDSYIAGYQFCAKKAVQGTKTLVQYSNSFIDRRRARPWRRTRSAPGAQVIFQVAGLCGDGALKEASKLGKWGIGVDADEYKRREAHPHERDQEDRRRRLARDRGRVERPRSRAARTSSSTSRTTASASARSARRSAEARPGSTLMNTYKSKIIHTSSRSAGSASASSDCATTRGRAFGPALSLSS